MGDPTISFDIQVIIYSYIQEAVANNPIDCHLCPISTDIVYLYSVAWKTKRFKETDEKYGKIAGCSGYKRILIRRLMTSENDIIMIK